METVEGSKVCLLEFWSVFFFWTGYLQEFGRQVLLIISERGRDEGGLFDLRVIDNYSNKKFFLKFHSYNSGSSKLEPPDILIKEGGGRGKGKPGGKVRHDVTGVQHYPTLAQNNQCCGCSIRPWIYAHSQSNKCAPFLQAIDSAYC